MTKRAAAPVLDLATADMAQLLIRARAAEAIFRILGGQIAVTNADRLAPDLYAALRNRRDELWTALGGDALHQPSIDLLGRLQIQEVVPQTITEAQELLSKIADDSRHHTLPALRDHPPILGIDTETAALPGAEDRPCIKLTRKGVPALTQPALKSDAGLDPYRSRIRLIQLYGGGDICAVIDTNLVPLSIVQPLLRQHTAVAHNISFELQHLGHAGLELPNIECTMQAAGLLLGVRRRALDDAADAYLGVTLPKELQTSDWGAPVLHQGQIAYAALDAIAAFWLWPKLHAELVSKGRILAYQLQRDVTPVAVRMTARGVKLDRARHQETVTEWSKALADARHAFRDTTGLAPPTTPEQLRVAMQRLLPPEQLSAWPQTPKSRKLSTSVNHLNRVAHIPAVRPLLEIKALETLLQNFGAPLADKVSKVTDRLHPGYHIASTKAGRSSSSRPNVQQIPGHKAPGFRDCLIAAPGYVLVVADFSLMELRAAAAISQDAQMTQDLKDNIDLHIRSAADFLEVSENEVSKDQRNAAKPINFGTIYGAGGAGLATSAWNKYGIAMTADEAAARRNRFLQRYFTHAEWMRRHATLCNQQGRIEIGHLGRVIEAAWERPSRTAAKHRFRDAGDDDYAMWADAIAEDDDEVASLLYGEAPLKYTLCCNAPIQGACADIAMLALLKADRAFRDAGIDGGLVLFVHDEIGAEVIEHQAELARALLTKAMTEAFAMVFPEAPLNGLVASAVGHSWGEAKP